MSSEKMLPDDVIERLQEVAGKLGLTTLAELFPVILEETERQDKDLNRLNLIEEVAKTLSTTHLQERIVEAVVETRKSLSSTTVID